MLDVHEVTGSSPVVPTIKLCVSCCERNCAPIYGVFFLYFRSIKRIIAERRSAADNGRPKGGNRLIRKRQGLCRRKLLFVCARRGIKFSGIRQIIDMKKIKENPLGKTREERESCFPACGRAELREERFARGEEL